MIKKILTSPLVVFAILGTGFFFVYKQIKVSKEEITISQQEIAILIQQNQELSPSPLTDSEKENIIQGYIDDEVLIREARKSGIDQTDSRVRKRMLQVMRSTLTENIPDPTFTQLQNFFEESIDRYTSDSSRSFVHVFFEFTNENIPDLDEKTIAILNSTSDLGSLGDFFMSGHRFPEYSFKQTASIFGRNFSEEIFREEVDKWFGPVDSQFGKHYVYVFAIHDPSVPQFEDVEQYLKQDYIFDKMRESQQKKIDEMKTNYNIIIEE